MHGDGSKYDTKGRCCSISNLRRSRIRLPADDTSIFSAEAKAIKLALAFIASHHGHKYIVFSDPVSVLQSISQRKFDNPFYTEQFHTALQS